MTAITAVATLVSPREFVLMFEADGQQLDWVKVVKVPGFAKPCADQPMREAAYLLSRLPYMVADTLAARGKTVADLRIQLLPEFFAGIRAATKTNSYVAQRMAIFAGGKRHIGVPVNVIEYTLATTAAVTTPPAKPEPLTLNMADGSTVLACPTCAAVANQAGVPWSTRSLNAHILRMHRSR